MCSWGLIVVAAGAGLLGLAAGTVAQAIIERMTTAQLRIRPRAVGKPFVVSAMGIAFAGVAALLGGAGYRTPALSAAGVASAAVMLVAYLYLAAISIVLAVIDIDLHRLPNAIVLPSYPVLIALFALAATMTGDAASFLRAVVGGAMLWAFYAMLRLLRPGGMGGGDVKLAGVLGLALGWLGWGPLVIGAFAAFLLGGTFGLILVVARRARAGTRLAFGPWMIGGAWLGIVFGRSFTDAYIMVLHTG